MAEPSSVACGGKAADAPAKGEDAAAVKRNLPDGDVFDAPRGAAGAGHLGPPSAPDRRPSLTSPSGTLLEQGSTPASALRRRRATPAHQLSEGEALEESPEKGQQARRRSSKVVSQNFSSRWRTTAALVRMSTNFHILGRRRMFRQKFEAQKEIVCSQIVVENNGVDAMFQVLLEDGTLVTADATTGQETGSVSLDLCGEKVIKAGAFSTDGSQLACGFPKLRLIVYNLQTPGDITLNTKLPKSTFEETAKSTIRTVSWSKDDWFVIVGGEDCTARVVDPATGEERGCFGPHKDFVVVACLSPNGTL